MYTFDARVRYSEIDNQGKMTLPALINYFQDCSTFHSEDIGLGVDALREQKKAWILSYWQVIVDRFPAMGESVTIGTFATGFKGLYGDRNFIMTNEHGEQLACANSVWVFMDLMRARPVKPGDEHIVPYGIEPPLDMQYEGRKIAIPRQTEACPCFPVRCCHIDTNEHVNNCQYVLMAMEMLPKNILVRQMRAEYKKSAVYGDIIYPRVAVEKDRTVVELCNEAGNLYAVIELC